MKVLIVLIVLGASRIASAQTDSMDKTFHVAVGVFVVSAIWDAESTRRCVEAGTCHEVNPPLALIARSHGIRTAMTAKLAAQGGELVLLTWLKNRHDHQYRTPATVALVGLATAQMAVNAWNWHQLHRGIR